MNNTPLNENEYALIKLLFDVVEDFMPNIATCVIQDYGRLNEALIKARAYLDDNKKDQENE